MKSMKNIKYLFGFLMGVAPVLGQGPAGHQGFEKLKSIAGKWRGPVKSPYVAKRGEGDMATLEYQTISGGNALMETLTFDGAPPMVSIYHPDGRQLMMTHYCSSANQPRVRTKQTEWSAASDLFEFHYLDATNVLSSDQMHIERMSIQLTDKDHLVQMWSDGKMEVRILAERIGPAPEAPASSVATPASAAPAAPASPSPR